MQYIIINISGTCEMGRGLNGSLTPRLAVFAQEIVTFKFFKILADSWKILQDRPRYPRFFKIL